MLNLNNKNKKVGRTTFMTRPLVGDGMTGVSEKAEINHLRTS